MYYCSVKIGMGTRTQMGQEMTILVVSVVLVNLIVRKKNVMISNLSVPPKGR